MQKGKSTKMWLRFTRFLADIRLPLTNNEAECTSHQPPATIRHGVMGRKNFYGAATHSGAQSAATLYTVIESCKKNDIDPGINARHPQTNGICEPFHRTILNEFYQATFGEKIYKTIKELQKGLDD